MKLTTISAPEFDLAVTLDSGQVFHWERQGDGFIGAIRDTPAYVEQRGNQLKVSGVLGKEIRRYFSFDHPLNQICSSFPADEAMKSARDFCRGLRIIRQPKWECLATFICSSMKQVRHIRQISRALRERFGEKKKIGDFPVYIFPSAKRLANTEETRLRQCGLGYRASNLLATAQRVHSGEADLNSWSKLTDPDLRDALCQLPGVGPKVANCVMLFAYERVRAFPIDVWIERVLRDIYFSGKRKVTRNCLTRFASGYFGSYGGYAQQYLFHHARSTKGRTSHP